MKEKDGLQLVCKYRKAIMGFAALWILVYHVWFPIFQSKNSEITVEIFLKMIGNYGVDIFFFMSGIGLTYAIKKTSIKQFYIRRIRRILLPYLITMITISIMDHWSWNDLLGVLTGYSYFFKTIYTFFWFIPTIIVFYIVFPMYYHFFELSKNKVVFTTTILLLWLLCTICSIGFIRYEWYGVTNRVPICLLGIYAGWRSQQRINEYHINEWSLLLLMLFAGLQFSYLVKVKGYAMLVPDSAYFLPGLLVAVSTSFLLAKCIDFLGKQKIVSSVVNLIRLLLEFIGGFTLELYCVQERFELLMLGRIQFLNVIGINICLVVGSIVCGFILAKICSGILKQWDRLHI